MRIVSCVFTLSAFMITLVAAGNLDVGAALAAETGRPVPWQLGLQAPVTPVMEGITDFWNMLLVVMAGIAALVAFLLFYVCYRFSAKRNPVPSKRAHNVLLETVWTLIPILILISIAVPAFRLLYFMDKAQDAEMTLKVVGHQWYWTYEYPDHGSFSFDAIMVADDELTQGQPRLLATDNNLVLPVNTTIRVLVTSDDVIHSWAVPAFGIKSDAVPGRLNETWVKIEREGMYYGMCSELCGIDHGFMPIAVKAVSKEAFAAWASQAREQFARADEPRAPAVPVHLAGIEAPAAKAIDN